LCLSAGEQKGGDARSHH